MESSNTELNRTTSSPELKHDHDTTASANLKKYSSEIKPTTSSSTKSPSADHRPSHKEDDDKSSSSTAPSPPHKNDKISLSEDSVPEPEPSETSPVREAMNEPPPGQEMERSPSAYRIPSSVFERSRSSSPLEWSVASNESLFSIHNGNMSFANDQYFWRSGELGPPMEASTSDQMFSYPAHDSAGGAAADMRSRELGIAEATMLEVIKESEGRNHVNATSIAQARNARRSEGSSTSNKSFAFSVMGGDTGSSVRMPSSARSNHEQLQTQPAVRPEPQPDPNTPAETGNEAQSRWLSCFSCCSFR